MTATFMGMNWAELLALAAILLTAGIVWLVYQGAHAPYGWEDESGWHEGKPDEPEAIIFDWPEQDRSEVRNPGLGR